MLIALLAVNLETSDKITGQPWHLDIFKRTSEYPCYPKSFIFPWNQPLMLLNCTEVSFIKVATRWQQRPAFGTQHTNGLTKNFVCFLPSDAMTETFFIFPQTTGLNNYWTKLSLCVPLPSAPFEATSVFHRPTTFSSFRPGNSSRCLLQSSREGKFLSNKRNSQRPN